MTAPLTPKETKVYEFIKKYSALNGFPPTYMEIQEEFELKAIGSVQQYIEQLHDKGYIKNKIGLSKKRSLELVSQEQNEIVRAMSSEVISVPLEGKVAAGRLTEAVQNREYIDIPKSLVKQNADYFALKVKGDSMIEEHIMDGDLVIIKRQNTASNGQTVVAIVDNEATIKKFYHRKTHIELVPANPEFEVIKVKPSPQFKILGILSSVIRTVEA